MAGLRVALVDDHPPILRGAVDAIASVLPLDSALTVHRVNEVLDVGGPYDVVVLDLQLGDGSDPVDNVSALVGKGWPTLLYTQETNAAVVGRCFRAGASGIVGKTEELSVLADAVRIVAGGEPYLSGDWAGVLDSQAQDIPNLAPREAEALRLYATGLPMKSVARRMGISPDTVKDYLMRVRRRYDLVGRPAATKTDLYIRAVEDGFVDGPRSTR